MQDAGPAEDVATPRYLGRSGREQADGTASGLGAAGAQPHLLNQSPVNQQVGVVLVAAVVARHPHHKLSVGLQVVLFAIAC